MRKKYQEPGETEIKDPIKPEAQRSPNLIESLYSGMIEQTFRISPQDYDSQLAPYNPDDLWQKTGDYSIYEDMLIDDQVIVCSDLKKDLILSGGWDLVVTDDDQEEQRKQIIDLLNEDFEGEFDQALEEILSANDFGFSITEKIFKNTAEGLVCLKALKTRHPNTWTLHTDAKGNVVKYEQTWNSGSIVVDPNSIIHFKNRAKFQNPYGQSDLRAAYNAYFVKRQIVKYLGIFLEKGASPIPVAKYSLQASKKAVDDIFNAIKSFQQKTALAIPKEFEVEFLESKSSGEAYSKAINLMNMFIGRAMFIPDLMGFQGSETGGGSYSLGENQIGIFYRHIMRRRQALESAIQRHIIKPLYILNFGFAESYPKFKFNPLSDADAVEYAKLWLDAVKGKAFPVTDEEINHFRRAVKFPEASEEEMEELRQRNAPPAMAPGSEVDPENTPAPGGDEEEPAEEDDSEPEAPQAPKEMAHKTYARPPGGYDKKVNYKDLGALMDRGVGKILAETKPVVKKIVSNLLEQIQKKGIVQNQASAKLETLGLKFTSELGKIIQANQFDAYEGAKQIAANELGLKQYRAPLPDEKFLKYLEDETWVYVGDWEYSMLKDARVRLMKAIRDGIPLSTVLDDIEKAAFDNSLVSIERYARTKLTDVMNRGRLAYFNESGLIDAYQYSAVMDDRTTEICSGLHGKVFKNGTEPIPPLHFNCRSVLIPITKYEDWKADKSAGGKNIDKFIDENLGDGFPRR